MKASVVVPVYNAKKSIGRCLSSLIKQSFKDYEIIIVDNGSGDGSFEIVKEFISAHPEKKIKLLREAIRGPSAARNRGIREAAGEVAAFTDADCVADEKWLKELVRGFDNVEVAAVAGNIRGYQPSNLIEKFLSVFTLRGLKEEKVFDVYTLLSGGFPTANLAIRKELLNQVGGFSGPRYGEDHNLCFQLYKLGFKICYITSALIYHIHRSNLREMTKQSFGFGKAHAGLMRKCCNRMLIIELPKYTYQNPDFGFPLWLNLNYADKKMLFFLMPGFLNGWLFLLPTAYFLYLCLALRIRFKEERISVSILELFALPLLLLIKSAAMTCGRIYGSFKNRVVCI